ncbi:MAG: hypothetical protein ACE148_04935 [Vicinamibacterales bacterium]
MAIADLEPRVTARLEAWRRERIGSRIWARDHTVWSREQVPELSDRLGWLALPSVSPRALDRQLMLADEVAAEGFERVLLLGMGGSSLAPELYQETFGNAPHRPMLTVLDSTHPAAVESARQAVPLERTLFVVSSKSGTTIESASLLSYFWAEASKTSREPGRQFVAITDPATPLERLAVEGRMRQVFTAPPDVGGRYSALSVFGTVPAALIGVDLHRLLQRAQIMARACAVDVPETSNPALQLGAVLGEAARAGRDKLTFCTSRSVASLPTWLEQLIAESTGKGGRGIIPVAGEALGSASTYGPDRFFASIVVEGDPFDETPLDRLTEAGFAQVGLRLADRYDVGQEIFRWEMATAAAGAILGVHPFDQPDVQLAKDLARQAMSKDETNELDSSRERLVEVDSSNARALERGLESLFESARIGDYVSIQAYLAPHAAVTASLAAMQAAIRDRTRLATTCGFGPRFLHSTGQLHKGGPNTGIFLQLVDEPPHDVPVPGTDYTFGKLIRAQALGDYRALTGRLRRVLRINLGHDTLASLQKVREACVGI